MTLQIHDRLIITMSGSRPIFDPVMHDFLINCRDELVERSRGGLLDAKCLDAEVPWLWRLALRTRGLVSSADGDIQVADHHVVAVRFLPDYLRRAERFEMLALVEPSNAFHPNLAPPSICIQLYPGEPLMEICESIHALISWRLRQLSEFDALNKTACAWGRAHLDELPIDSRPLFGRSLQIALEPAEDQP